MSNSDFVEVDNSESFDICTVDSMDVEGDGPSELKPSNAVLSDRGWQKLGPHDGPQAAVDDELPEPAKCFLLHECAVLNSRFGNWKRRSQSWRGLQQCSSATLHQLRNNRRMSIWLIVLSHWKRR